MDSVRESTLSDARGRSLVMCMMRSVGIVRIARTNNFKSKTAVFVIGATWRKICSSVINAIPTSAFISSKHLKERTQKRYS